VVYRPRRLERVAARCALVVRYYGGGLTRGKVDSEEGYKRTPMISQGFAVSLLPLVLSVLPTLFLPLSSLSPRAYLVSTTGSAMLLLFLDPLPALSPFSDYSSTRFISPRGFRYRATERRKLKGGIAAEIL